MHCAVNNLPNPKDRKPWEDAVVKGVGPKAAKVDHYSIIAAQDTAVVQVRLHVQGEPAPRALDIAPETHGLDDVPELVSGMIPDL